MPYRRYLQTYIEAQIQSGGKCQVRWSIFVYLVQQDRQRKQAQEKLERLLQEALDSESEPVNPTYWQNLLRIGIGCRFSRNMSYRLIIRDRATQDLRQQANYILVNGNSHAAGQFLELAEVTFAQLATIPKMGVDFCPPKPQPPPTPQLWGEKRGNRSLKSPRIGGFRGLILRVLHGARDLEGILSNLDEEI